MQITIIHDSVKYNKILHTLEQIFPKHCEIFDHNNIYLAKKDFISSKTSISTKNKNQNSIIYTINGIKYLLKSAIYNGRVKYLRIKNDCGIGYEITDELHRTVLQQLSDEKFINDELKNYVLEYVKKKENEAITDLNKKCNEMMHHEPDFMVLSNKFQLMSILYLNNSDKLVRMTSYATVDDRFDIFSKISASLVNNKFVHLKTKTSLDEYSNDTVTILTPDLLFNGSTFNGHNELVLRTGTTIYLRDNQDLKYLTKIAKDYFQSDDEAAQWVLYSQLV